MILMCIINLKKLIINNWSKKINIRINKKLKMKYKNNFSSRILLIMMTSKFSKKMKKEIKIQRLKNHIKMKKKRKHNLMEIKLKNK